MVLSVPSSCGNGLCSSVCRLAVNVAPEPTQALGLDDGDSLAEQSSHAVDALFQRRVVHSRHGANAELRIMLLAKCS